MWVALAGLALSWLVGSPASAQQWRPYNPARKTLPFRQQDYAQLSGRYIMRHDSLSVAISISELFFVAVGGRAAEDSLAHLELQLETGGRYANAAFTLVARLMHRDSLCWQQRWPVSFADDGSFSLFIPTTTSRAFPFSFRSHQYVRLRLLPNHNLLVETSESTTGFLLFLPTGNATGIHCFAEFRRLPKALGFK